MNTSSRFVVAIHILTGLSIREKFTPDEPNTSDLLAESVNTNPVVIRRILGSLRKAGLVLSQTGADGGFTLAKGPEEISLLDIYRVVEKGELFRMHYKMPSVECPVGCHIQDTLKGVLCEAQTAMEDVLGRTTVADLSEDLVKRSDFLQMLAACMS